MLSTTGKGLPYVFVDRRPSSQSARREVSPVWPAIDIELDLVQPWYTPLAVFLNAYVDPCHGSKFLIIVPGLQKGAPASTIA